jgi:hypothetical protein
MPPATVQDSLGNGDGYWMALLVTVRECNRELHGLAPSIRQAREPEELDDLIKASQVLDRLTVHVRNAHGAVARRKSDAEAAIGDLEGPLVALGTSLQEAADAVADYSAALEEEHEQREYDRSQRDANLRRTIKRRDADRKALRLLAMEAGSKLDELLTHVDGLLGQLMYLAE